MDLRFTPRAELAAYEWDAQSGRWQRPEIDPELLKALSERSTANGLLRLGLHLVLLAAAATAVILAGRVSLWLAVPALYVYYFFYGFWVAIAHELQHKIVLAKRFNWLSEIFFFVVQVLLWNSPRYARISHRLHHRYTMVRGIDPETEWPEVITSRWLKRYFWGRILAILLVGALVDLARAVRTQIQRLAGVEDRMMRDHCDASDRRAIRRESAAILLIHLAIVVAAIAYRRWEPLLLITIAWQVGWAIEGMWHQTEHIGRLYNVNDQRLCTRSIRVGPLIKAIYWGLDDHVDHHLFPGVPSRHLPKLHRHLQDKLPKPRSMFDCWREMFAIAREKDRHPEHEYVPLAEPSTAVS